MLATFVYIAADLPGIISVQLSKYHSIVFTQIKNENDILLNVRVANYTSKSLNQNL